MVLDYVLLGLCRTPSSGYDLKAVFDVAIRHFWRADLSQVYPALRSLERRRLLRSRVVPPARGPRRRVYETTAAGRAALRRWLAAGPAWRDERYVLGAQVFLLDALGRLDESARFIRQLRAGLRTRRAVLSGHLTAGPRRPGAAADRSTGEFHHELALRLGLHTLDARAAWCGEALRMIRRRTAVAGRQPRSRP